ncbi:MAG TPA: hypothetical protein VGL46_21470 [Pseudonocardiaceae bacterium]
MSATAVLFPVAGALVNGTIKSCFTCGNGEAELRRDLPLRHAYPEAATLCGRCWAQFGGQSSAAEIGAAPAAALEVRSAEPAEWAAVFAGQPWRTGLRRDARRRVDALVRVLRNRADWDDGECWPTWARLQADTGWARSTLASWLRQLWILGWIDRVEPGSTPWTRPMGSPVEGNRAAVYGLRVPAYAERQEPAQARRQYTLVLADLTTAIAQLKALGGKTWTPTGSLDPVELRIEVGYLRTRARQIFHNLGSAPEVEETKIEPLRGSFDHERAQAWAEKVPTTRGEMLAAAAELRRQHPVFGRMTDRAIRSACRPWWRAGWCNLGILHALRYRPTGWTGTTAARSHAEYAVIHPAGWVRSRLSMWRDDQGNPLREVTAQRALRQSKADFWTALDDTDRATYGRVGMRLVRKCGFVDIPSAVAEHGRQAAAELAREQRADRSRRAATAAFRRDQETRRSQRRAVTKHTALQQQLIDQAHAIAPAPSAASSVPTPPVPAEPETISPQERTDRARRQAETLGHGSRRAFGRRRPRW